MGDTIFKSAKTRHLEGAKLPLSKVAVYHLDSNHKVAESSTCLYTF